MPRKDAVIFTVLAVLVLSGTTLYFISRRRMASVRNVGLILMFAGAAGVAIPLVPFTLSVFAGNENSRISVTGSEVKLKEENRLIIPEIGVDMPIAQNENALERGGWVFPDASTPDGGGNTVIFGHRFKYLPPLSNTFYQLDRVKTGDTFSLSWQGKIYNYRITEMKIIRPEDLSVLSREGTARVSLITCTPLFSSKQRLVITGELLN
jgi:sortase A